MTPMFFKPFNLYCFVIDNCELGSLLGLRTPSSKVSLTFSEELLLSLLSGFACCYLDYCFLLAVAGLEEFFYSGLLLLFYYISIVIYL